VIDTGDIDVFLGLDAGKGQDHTQTLFCRARRQANVRLAMSMSLNRLQQLQTARSILRPKPLTSGLKPLVIVRGKELSKRLVERSGDSMDRRPDRRIVYIAAEVRHLELLQPVRQHQCLVTRELDRDLGITHSHPYGSACP
jgi:hypothetical protein